MQAVPAGCRGGARAPSRSRHAHPGVRYVALLVDDAAAEVQRAAAAGALVMSPVVSHRPDASYAMIRDPDGNIWELLQES